MKREIANSIGGLKRVIQKLRGNEARYSTPHKIQRKNLGGLKREILFPTCS
jgi:hypothetical protein